MHDDEPRRRKAVCLRCGYAITWAEQRRQYGRAIRHSLTPDQMGQKREKPSMKSMRLTGQMDQMGHPKLGQPRQ
jgi:hypothetical protein